MARFSDRYNCIGSDIAVEREALSNDLRDALWKIISERYWKNYHNSYRGIEEATAFASRLWVDYFNLELDDFGSAKPEGVVYERIKANFIRGQWHEVFDFLEFAAQLAQRSGISLGEGTIAQINQTLSKYNTTYQFVGNEVTEVNDFG